MKTYTITTFGCQMNISDSERVAAICSAMGYVECPAGENADLYVLNTCSVRQKAEDRVLGMGKKFFNFKQAKPDTKIVLTGCMAKRDIRQGYEKSHNHQQKYAGKLQKQMPWIDFVLEINDMHHLPELLGITISEQVSDYFAVKPHYNSCFQAFVPISTGCNKFCTFCIVPFTRGKEVYREYEQLYTEVSTLINSGYKEITLLGQNVNSWRNDNLLKTPITSLRGSESENEDFAFLMEQFAHIEGDYWLRFTSSHPYDINMRLIDVIAKEDKIAKQIHFALQSGSDSVLKRMNRYYTREEFRKKVLEIKERIPGISITTDVIVGFSGETEEEFMDTIRLCEELRFDQIFISEYSRREGTIAAKFYTDDIPSEVKAARKNALDAALRVGLDKNNQELVGTTQKVLIYKTKVKNRNGVFGRTTHAKDILIETENPDSFPIGEFVQVQVTGYHGFCLEGALKA
jgi:tRNA-2-methylthio-N6-dimethylallyladenosine synthase